jgi:DNA repair exonuclease SbcCD ATPase subunit
MKERATKTSSEWEQWPGRTPDPQPRKRLRGLFMPTDAADEVANLLAEHGKELEERSAQIREAVVALEQREERARELHFRVEQVLRDGALELDLRQAELSTRSSELDAREAAVARAEEKVESRRRALGAVELRAAAAKRREDDVRLREQEVGRRAAELAEHARELDERETSHTRAASRPVREDEHVVLVSTADRYRLVIRPGPPPEPGSIVELDETPYRTVRLTASPLPGDDRSCALLEVEPELPG